ncbi:hypothetical protein KI387_033025, partial [Taxus chinensis]
IQRTLVIFPLFFVSQTFLHVASDRRRFYQSTPILPVDADSTSRRRFYQSTPILHNRHQSSCRQ